MTVTGIGNNAERRVPTTPSKTSVPTFWNYKESFLVRSEYQFICYSSSRCGLIQMQAALIRVSRYIICFRRLKSIYTGHRRLTHNRLTISHHHSHYYCIYTENSITLQREIIILSCRIWKYKLQRYRNFHLFVGVSIDKVWGKHGTLGVILNGNMLISDMMENAALNISL